MTRARKIAAQIAALVVVFMPCPSAAAPCAQTGIDAAKWLKAPTNKVSITFSSPVRIPAMGEHVAWALVDAADQIVIAIANPHYSPNPGGPATTASSVYFDVPGTMRAGHPYYVSVANLIFVNCAEPQTLIVTLNPRSGSTTPPLVVFGPAKDRLTSDLYLAGAWDVASGTVPAYTADLKVQFSWYLVDPSSSPPRPGVRFRPFYDFKASTNPSANGNSVTAGAAFPLTLPGVTRLVTEPAFVIESDKNYQDVNAIVRWLSYIVPAVISLGGGGTQVHVQPVVGLEAGVNAASPVGGAYAASIFRVFGGAHVYVNVFHDSDRTAYIEFDGIVREPVHNEPSFGQGRPGSLKLLGEDTSLRTYASTRFGLDFTKYVGVSFQYEYGELPPTYFKVKNKLTLSLVVKSTLSNRP